MAGVDVASNQALLQAGLQQDIFARARSSVTDSSGSSQSSSSSSHMRDSVAGLTVSGILAVANESMPSPLRPPETSWQPGAGLHNSGNWLTASGNFTFATSGATFPFFPPLPETPAADQHVHHPMHPPMAPPPLPSATAPASTEARHGWRQASSASSSAPSPSIPRTSVVRPQAMNNFYHTKVDAPRGEQAMAFWRLGSAELVSYNETFGALLEVAPATLQDGFLWCSIRVVDQDMRVVSIQDEGTNALKAIQEFVGLVTAGTARYSQISFSFLSGRNQLKHMHVTMVAFHEEILWICSEIGSDSSFRSPAPRRMTQQHANHQHIQGALSASSDSAPLAPAGPNDRKLVKVATRKKKPWDQNLVKFSLKKMRKRSKRKADQQA